MGTTSKFYLLLILSLLISSCESKSTGKQITSTATRAEAQSSQSKVPERRELSADEWKSAIDSTHVATNRRDTGNGMSEFFACFDPIGKKCRHSAFATRDTFRKVSFFTTGLSSSTNLKNPLFPYIASYISLKDSGKPIIVLSPVYTSRNGWLFIENVSFMLDDKIVIQHAFKQDDVRRDADGGVVDEIATFFLDEQQVDELRKISADRNLLIRINGKDSYVGIKPEQIKSIIEEIENAVFIYDKINYSISAKEISLTR